MMRFSPPTEITPEPTPEFVLNYDASCLPSVTAPENIIESGNGESLNLVTIPPLEGEFSLLETGIMQESQSNITFLTVDTDIEDTSFQRTLCTDAEYDCSLHGAVYHARIRYPQEFVIIIPNGTYRLSESLYIVGNMHLVASNYYDGARYPGVVIQSTGNNFYLMGIDSHALVGDGMSHVSLYNIAIENRESAYHSLKITNSQVGIYYSRFSNLTHYGLGGGILWHDNSNRASDITIANTVFENNSAYVGGGIAAKDTAGSLNLACVTFKDNEASTRGGAIGTDYFDGTISIFKSNFINNRSQSGGAVHRVSGSSVITFEQTYWSPNYSGNPTIPNSIINAETGGIIMGTSVPVPNTFNCQVPPPPRKPICIVSTSGTITYRNNNPDDPIMEISLRSEPTTSSSRIRVPLNFSGVLNFYITGRQLRPDGYWYLGEYRGIYYYNDNLSDSREGVLTGWFRYDLIATTDLCDYAQLVDDNGNPVTLELADNDFILAPPNPQWLGLSCDGTNTQDDNIECTKQIYYIYYEVFKRVYGREPRLSDVLASTYQNELKIITDSGYSGINGGAGQTGSEIALRALAGNYWAIQRTYCNRTGICNDKIENMEHFVGNYPENSGGGYLWTLEAWYSNATNTISAYSSININQINRGDFEFVRNNLRHIFRLLPKPDIIEIANMALTDSQKLNSTYLVWGNFAFGSDEYDIFVPTPPTTTIFCIVNIYGILSKEDAFAVTTENYETSIGDQINLTNLDNRYLNEDLTQCPCNDRTCLD